MAGKLLCVVRIVLVHISEISAILRLLLIYYLYFSKTFIKPGVFYIFMHMMRRKKQDAQKTIALERISTLFKEAESQFKEYPELSRRYMVLATRMAERYKVHLTKDQKRKCCKKCHAYLVQGVNSRIRLQHGILVIRCLECNQLRRLKYK